MVVEKPSFGDRLLADVVAAHFSFGDHAGAEIGDDRRVGIAGRYRGAERVGAQPGFQAAGGRDALPSAAIINGRHQDDSLTGCAFGVFAQASDMPAISRRRDRDPERSGLWQHQVEQPVRLDLTQSPVTVADHHGRRLALDLERRADLNLAAFYETDVLDEPHHAVRIVAPQVCTDQARRHHRRVVARHAARHQQVDNEFVQGWRGDGSHRLSVFECRLFFASGRCSAADRMRNASVHPGPSKGAVAGDEEIPLATRNIVPILARGWVFAIVRRPWSNRGTQGGAGRRDPRSQQRQIDFVEVPMPFRVATQAHGQRTVYSLHDDGTGAMAAVLPSYGFNMFDLRLPVAGEVRSVLASAADFADNPGHPAGNGTPILFPFPNRIKDGRFAFQGRTYKLPATNGPNAIHGFAVAAAWDVVEHKATADSADIVGRYQISKQSPEAHNMWPADAVLQVRYSLSGRRLSMTVTVSNPTADDLPYGFGIHPYFRLPFPPGGDLARTQVVLAASRYWVLKEFLPTGEIKPVDARLDFRTGQAIKGLRLDDVLTGLEFHDRRGVARLVDLDKKGEFRLTFDDGIRELVVYTPPGKPDVLAVEPYTQTTDAINLQTQGIDAGLRILGHGHQETFTLTMETVG